MPKRLATLRRYAPFTASEDQARVMELDGLLEKLATSRKHALLVGIDKYHSQDVPRLKGARNDVAAIKQLLTQHWGFQPEDIVELVDAKATRAVDPGRVRAPGGYCAFASRPCSSSPVAARTTRTDCRPSFPTMVGRRMCPTLRWKSWLTFWAKTPPTW